MMKKLILIASHLILLSYQLVGQFPSFSFADRNNYFIADGKVYDVRNFKQINNAPIGQRMPFLSHSQKQVLIDYDPGLSWTSGSLAIIDKNGKQKYSGTVQNSVALISYDRYGILSVKENDLWYTPINLESGVLLTSKRLTNLGIFQSGLPMFHWYGNNILINADNSSYAINLDNNQMTHLPFLAGSIPNPIQSYFMYSPSGRYIICPSTNKAGEAFFYFDTKTLKQNYFNPNLFPSLYNNTISDGYYTTWISDNEMFFWNGRSNGADPQREQSFYLCDLLRNKCKLVGQVKDIKNYVVDYDMRRNKGKTSVTMSPDTTFMAVPFLIRGRGNAVLEEYVNIFNIKKSIWVTPKLPIQLNNGVMMTADQELVFAWISSSKLVYKQSNGIDQQGTWLFDAEKNEKIKLTSFQPEKILVLPEAGYTVFIANNHLFRIKNDGSGFQQLTTSPLRNSSLSMYSEDLRDYTKSEFYTSEERTINIKNNTGATGIITGKYIFISNNDLRINTETGLAASQRKDGDWSAHWTLRQVPNTNYYWIENRWKSGERLHVEEPSIKSGKIKDDAWSAQWEFVPVGDSYVIQNRWRQGFKICIENGNIKCATISNNSPNSLWKLKTVE